MHVYMYMYRTIELDVKNTNGLHTRMARYSPLRGFACLLVCNFSGSSKYLAN
jgi:hypothetical protein